MAVQIDKWVFTVDEYHRMAETGILSENARVELIEGEIIRMSPIGRNHAGSVNRLATVLIKKIDKDATVSIQTPVRLDDYSEPQPDIALLKYRDDYYTQVATTAESVLLIIEVSDSSLDFDRKVKVPLYAKNGIPEVWLKVVSRDRIEGYSKPINGKYESFRIIERGESISPEMLPTLVLTADEILG